MTTLTNCPYCKSCEVGLDELQLIFNPESETQAPCEHLVWLDGRYSDWGISRHGVDHVIASSELHWEHPILSETEIDSDIAREEYFAELTQHGMEWDFAPSVPFTLVQIWDENKTTDSKGKEHADWDVDGWAIFAEDPKACVEAITQGHLDWAQSMRTR